MRIIPFDRTRLNPVHPNLFNDFGRFSALAGDFDFIEFSEFDDEKVLRESHGRKLVYFETEEPNRFFVSLSKNFSSNMHDPYRERYAKILTTCPYTADWFNKRYKDQQRVPVFFPLNETHIPEANNKRFDVIYAGHIVAPEIGELVRTMSSF